MKRPQFVWNEEDGSSLCVIQDKNNFYYGTAQCSYEDQDMKSEKTGCEIAYRRASIKALKGKKQELMLELKGLKKYYYSINQNKSFNADSFESKRLIHHIKTLTNDIENLKQLIIEHQKELKDYLDKKAVFYKKIRQNRKIDKILDEHK